MTFPNLKQDFFKVVKAGEVSKVHDLIAKGVDLNTQDPDTGDSGLMVAYANDQKQLIAYFLSQPNIDITLRNKEDHDIVDFTWRRPNTDTIRFLMDMICIHNLHGAYMKQMDVKRKDGRPRF